MIKEVWFKLLIFLIFGLNYIPLTNSEYRDQSEINSLTLKTADWVAPESQADPLPEYMTTSSFPVSYSVSDAHSLVDKVWLYYRFEGGSWTYFDDDDFADANPYAGSFSFLSAFPCGEIEFFTIGVDVWGNIENDTNGNGVLEESEYPLADTSTFICTLAPNTSLLSGNFINDTQIINEKVSNGNFEAGLLDWETIGDVSVITGDVFEPLAYDGSYMAKIGDVGEPGNEIWENKLSQKIDNGAKNVSFYYNFYTMDSFFDNPGMIVKINDYEVFRITAFEVDDMDPLTIPNSTGWNQVSFDLTGIADPVLEIIFYSGNTSDEYLQSWVYIDNVTTSEVFASDATEFHFMVAHCCGVASTHYSLDGIHFTLDDGTGFMGSDLPSDDNIVSFYSIDNAGNVEGIKTRRIVKNNNPPSQVIDLSAVGISKAAINVSWTAPLDDSLTGQAMVYDLRYRSEAEGGPILTEADFTASHKVSNLPAPKLPGSFESFDVPGLDSSTTYHFALKSGDSAPNWSLISNPAVGTTLSFAVDPDVSEGEVVINELMWMGSKSFGPSDEWIEIRNMTGEFIDLSWWQFVKVNGGVETCMYTFSPGVTLAPHGYLLVSEYDEAHSAISLTCPGSDCLVVGGGNTDDLNFELADIGLNLRLYDGDPALGALLIDQVDNGQGDPAGGEYDNLADIYFSMERNDSPGNGYDASSWHTCLANPGDISLFWDSGFVEKGTPGNPNLSQFNFPYLSFYLDQKKENVGFKVFNLLNWEDLNYEVSYDSDQGSQGILGQIEVKGLDFIKRDDLKLGTCSAEGKICTFNTNVSNLNLKVILKNGDQEKIMEKGIE